MGAAAGERRGLAALALPLLLLVAALAPLLTSGALAVDDRIFLRQDVRVRDPAHRAEILTRGLFPRDLQGSMRAAPGDASLYYRPVVLFSMAWTRDLVGDAVTPHHALNVLFHGLAVLLLAALVRPGHHPLAAGLAALVLAVHPTVAEPVGWIAGRADLLALLFTLGALGVLLREGARESPPGPGRIAAAAGLFLLAALSKETALLLGPLLPLATWLRFGRAGPGWAAFLPGAGLALAARAAVLGGLAPPGAAPAFDPAVIAGTAFRWLQHLLLPYDLQVLFYDPGLWRPRAHVLDAGTAALLVLGAAAVLRPGSRVPAGPAGKRARLLGSLGSGLVVLPLLPVLGIVPLGYPFSDRYLYAPAAGLGLLLAAAVLATRGRGRHALAAAIALWSLAGAAVLRGRARAFADDRSLLGATLAQPYRPPRAFVFAAENHLAEGRAAEAMEVAQAGLAAHPTAHRMLLLIGMALRGLDRPEDAEVAFLEVPEASPLFGWSRTQAAFLARTRGDLEKARGYLDAAIAWDAGYHTAWGLRGELRLHRGDAAGALADLDRAVELEARDATTRFNRGLARRATGDREGALEELRAAAGLAPTRARFAGAVGQVLAELGRRDEARTWLERARRLEGP